MDSLIAHRQNFELAFDNDPDFDHQGIVTRSTGLRRKPGSCRGQEARLQLAHLPRSQQDLGCSLREGTRGLQVVRGRAPGQLIDLLAVEIYCQPRRVAIRGSSYAPGSPGLRAIISPSADSR